MPRGSCKNTGCVCVCLEAKNINKFNAIDLKKRVKIRFQAGKVGTLLSTCIVIEYASSQSPWQSPWQSRKKYDISHN